MIQRTKERSNTMKDNKILTELELTADRKALQHIPF